MFVIYVGNLRKNAYKSKVKFYAAAAAVALKSK